MFPAVIIPITLALLAAYAFAWIDFKGRDFLFVAIFALQIVPLQVALIPLQTIFVNFGLQNSFWPVWIAHTIFGLPLAIFLLHNFMKEVPAVDRRGGPGRRGRAREDLLRRADAAARSGDRRVRHLPVPVGVERPAGRDRVRAEPEPHARSRRRSPSLSGTRGSDWQLLSAGAFIAIIVPLVVFLGLQRYFVRGLLAGGVKG